MAEEDSWVCPAGQRLTFRRVSQEWTERGYEIRQRHYRSSVCQGCPLKPSCTKAAGNREIKASMEYLRHKQMARERLKSEEGRS
ncbi:transposase [Paenibacillus abyssi]|uniref:transposase n=1 Tax=Paenibacillus abyssi TaxID=1340531 RepID=UPI0016633EF1|nr:transposase [Paenibacillus abyssi]